MEAGTKGAEAPESAMLSIMASLISGT